MPVPGSPALILLPVRVFVLTPKPRPPTRTPTLFFPTFMCTPLAIRIRLRKRTVPSFLPPPRCLIVAGDFVQFMPHLCSERSYSSAVPEPWPWVPRAQVNAEDAEVSVWADDDGFHLVVEAMQGDEAVVRLVDFEDAEFAVFGVVEPGCDYFAGFWL